jgi:ABC-type Mn2+/Zn2+ transport system permease subunit
MNVVLARAHVVALRLGWALRRHWKRIGLGVACGWVIATVLGAIALVWLETRGVISPDDAAPIVGAAFVWSGMALGGVIAYAVRPRRVEPASHRG